MVIKVYESINVVIVLEVRVSMGIKFASEVLS